MLRSSYFLVGLSTIMGKLDRHSGKVLFGVAVSTSDFVIWGSYVIFSLCLSMKGKKKLEKEFCLFIRQIFIVHLVFADIGAGSTELTKFKKRSPPLWGETDNTQNKTNHYVYNFISLILHICIVLDSGLWNKGCKAGNERGSPGDAFLNKVLREGHLKEVRD